MDPIDYFQQLGNVCDTWNIDDFPLANQHGDTLKEVQSSLNIHVTSSVMARSEEDDSSSTGVLDYYWLTHDINLMPPNAEAPIGKAKEWTVRTLKVVVQQRSDISDGSVDSDQIQPAKASRCTKSSPQNQIIATTVGSSVTDTIGANVGFFGDTPTGGISGSTATTHTVSRPVMDVEFVNENQRSSAGYVFTFNGWSAGRADFQPSLQHVFSCEDPLNQKRSNAPEDADDVGYAIFSIDIDLELDLTWPGSSPDESVFVGHVQRQFSVLMPPLPAGTTPSDTSDAATE